MERQRILIIGNGMAGLKFIEEITALSPGMFDITVAGEEPDLAYNRVLLSALLAREITLDDVQLKPSAWYAASGVRTLQGDAIVLLNIKDKVAELASGRTCAFDICVFATGSLPVRLILPGATLEGVEVFRTTRDIERLVTAGRRGERAVVIGGGLLGIEAAYGLKRAGADVTLVHVMDRLMERQLDHQGAEILRAALNSKGIAVVLSAQTVRIEGGTGAEKLVLKDGIELLASLIVMAVGVKPRIDLAIASGLDCKRGISVNDQMQTSASGIYAIGECAEHRGQVYGLVEPAYEHARVAAHAIAGYPAAYEGTVLATNLKVSGVPVFSTGDFEGVGAEKIVLRDTHASSYRKFIVREGRLAGAVLVGDTHDALWYRDLIRQKTPIAPFRSTLAFGRAYAEAAE
jgi:nitrite reductase (NADH) large subunit